MHEFTILSMYLFQILSEVKLEKGHISALNMPFSPFVFIPQRLTHLLAVLQILQV